MLGDVLWPLVTLCALGAGVYVFERWLRTRQRTEELEGRVAVLEALLPGLRDAALEADKVKELEDRVGRLEINSELVS